MRRPTASLVLILLFSAVSRRRYSFIFRLPRLTLSSSWLNTRMLLAELQSAAIMTKPGPCTAITVSMVAS